jgi:SAM-dependent methyltransferase
MNLFLRGLARAVAEAFPLPGPVLEVGSFQVPGQEALADLRGLFPGRPYVGLDARPGPGVDVVADVEDLPQADSSVGTVLALSTFEHVPRFWRGFEEVHRVLRPDGALLVACPFYFHLHAHPSDYWRFTPAALELLLEPYPSKVVGWHGPASRPANVWALAFREGRPPISPPEYARYRALMSRYARMPLPWPRRLRYLLGRLLFGGTLFAPYLERERWQTQCLNRGGPRRAAARAREARRAEPLRPTGKPRTVPAPGAP